MGFVGPRPFMLDDIKIIKEIEPEAYNIRDKLLTKPGLTGCWQVFGIRKKGIENLIFHEKLYENKVSAKMDIKILLATIPLVFRGKLSDAILNGFNHNVLNKLQEEKTIIGC